MLEIKSFPELHSQT